MDKDIIIYKGQKYTRNPNSKRRQHRVYYWRHDKWKEPPFPLHRQIWIDNFGEIPKGYSVHHKDDNTLNNSIENLEILSHSQHAVLHMKDRKKEKIGICENELCKKEFIYHSIRSGKFCSYSCYSKKRRERDKKLAKN